MNAADMKTTLNTHLTGSYTVGTDGLVLHIAGLGPALGMYNIFGGSLDIATLPEAIRDAIAEVADTEVTEAAVRTAAQEWADGAAPLEAVALVEAQEEERHVKAVAGNNIRSWLGILASAAAIVIAIWAATLPTHSKMFASLDQDIEHLAKQDSILTAEDARLRGKDSRIIEGLEKQGRDMAKAISAERRHTDAGLKDAKANRISNMNTLRAERATTIDEIKRSVATFKSDESRRRERFQHEVYDGVTQLGGAVYAAATGANDSTSLDAAKTFLSGDDTTSAFMRALERPMEEIGKNSVAIADVAEKTSKLANGLTKWTSDDVRDETREKLSATADDLRRRANRRVR